MFIGFPRCSHPTTTSQQHFGDLLWACAGGKFRHRCQPTSAFTIFFLHLKSVWTLFNLITACFKSCNSDGNVNLLLSYLITPTWPPAHLLVAMWAHCSDWRLHVCRFKPQTKDVNVNSFVRGCFGLGECSMEQTAAACDVRMETGVTSPISISRN